MDDDGLDYGDNLRLAEVALMLLQQIELWLSVGPDSLADWRSSSFVSQQLSNLVAVLDSWTARRRSSDGYSRG